MLNTFSAASLFIQTEEQRLTYVNREMAIMDYQSDMNACKEEGREEGEAAGAIQMIKNFLAAGTPLEYIRKASGWTDEDILALKDKM